MNLAFCIFSYFPFGGMERNFLRITEACLAKGHQVEIFTMSWEGRQPQGAKITLVKGTGFTNHGRCQSYAAKLNKLIDPDKYDLRVGFNRMPELDLYYCADVCYVLDIGRRRSFLSRLTPRYKLFSTFERAVFGPDSSTHIMYLAEAEKANYQKIYQTPEQRFHPLPPGIDRQRIEAALSPAARQKLRKELNLQAQDLILLSVGSDFVRKGVERSILALASLPPHLRDKSHFLVIGKGKAQPLKQLAKRLGIGNQVHFPGPNDRVPEYLAGADLLLHPAVTENTGNVIAEALVAGLPSLATDSCGYGFHIQNSKAGCLVRGYPFDQQELNIALKEILESPKRQAMGEWARTYANKTDLYSRPTKAVQIIEEVAGQK